MNTLRRYWAWPFTGLGLLFLTVTVTPLVPWWATRLAGPWHDPKGETVIVLAGSLQSSGPEQLPIVGHNSYLRSVYALRAWREGWVRQILVSGDPITAVAMQRYLIASGIPPAAVLLDDRSRSTHDHPINCRRMLAPYPGPVVLLTSDYHMFRAHSVFRRAGMAVQPLPIPDIIKNSSSRLWRWQGFLQLIEESVKTVYYRYRRRLIMGCSCDDRSELWLYFTLPLGGPLTESKHQVLDISATLSPQCIPGRKARD